ncbi:AEC family transporter [Alphaproteobacteria bacterium KMM 3653]|uniref:AEC family transporter n=1 Tax=Harenicola maris TaxID=2841044 RepID=A0AAP2CQY5_9RHOB|nr:AEC family transporter [Harenicola maris]
MIAIFLAIAPVFLLIMGGYGLRRGGIPSVDFWNMNDKLVYWVLMPALFFGKISASDLTGAGIGRYALVLYIGCFGALACAGVMSRRMTPAISTSVMQGGARFNSFVGIAIAEALLGEAGLSAAVLAAALLVPAVNLTVVTLMTQRLGTGDQGGPRAVLRNLAKNPLILSILAGALFNIAGWHHVPLLHDCAMILGNAALPIMLLCVGANLKLRGTPGSAKAIGFASFAKFFINPALVIALLFFIPLGPVPAQVAVIFAALPASVAAYTLARQLGGDAPLMAAIITIQTLSSFLTLPLTLLLALALLGLGT